MEYLIVRFPESREVFIDRKPNGKTNIVLPLPPGTYTVTLGPPRNFAPLELKVQLESTTPFTPYAVTFDHLPPSAVPISPGSPP